MPAAKGVDSDILITITGRTRMKRRDANSYSLQVSRCVRFMHSVNIGMRPYGSPQSVLFHVRYLIWRPNQIDLEPVFLGLRVRPVTGRYMRCAKREPLDDMTTCTLGLPVSDEHSDITGLPKK